MHVYAIKPGSTRLFNRYPDQVSRTRLRRRGYFPRLGNVGLMPTMDQTEHEMIRALHGLDAACLFLVGKFIVRPLLALREYLRPRAAAGEFLAATAEPLTHETMLGLFAIPGLRWALALVMEGNGREATRIVAWKVIKTEHEACMSAARRHIGGQRSAAIERGRGLCNTLVGLALFDQLGALVKGKAEIGRLIEESEAP